MSRPVIALLTDFGTQDPFVGIVKAVVLSRCPEATFVDLTHSVPPQAVVEGAFLLERSVDWLPQGSVVVAVVDPGVGTPRRPIVLAALGRLFVGPDNGLLSAVAARDAASMARVIDTGRLGLVVASRTFHGRDVFAPVAAELAAGRLVPADVGADAGVLVDAAIPRPAVSAGVVRGTVVTVDRFGNLITNIGRNLVPTGAAVAEVGAARATIRDTYGEVGRGELVALVDAFDVLEIAERDGNAARALGAGRGTEVVVRSVASARG
ncbi:MAG TPA: SAM-dependent chlorinase/fluorinase [Polyangiaceae bacterium]|nr:SAM-dependent chlorinase/fluorinase [Polyangiaceae bacterium]